MSEQSERLKSIEDKVDTLVDGQSTLTKIMTGGTNPADGVIYKQVAHDGKIKGLQSDVEEMKAQDRRRTGWLGAGIIGVVINSMFDVFRKG